MNEMKDFVVRLAMVVLLLLGVGVSANAGNEMTLRMGGSVVGKIEQNGDVRIGGSIKGRFESNGDIRVNGSIEGKIESNGDIRKRGSIVGKVEQNGDVRISGSIVGKVESNGDIRKSGSIIGKVENLSNQRQAAVMYFFPLCHSDGTADGLYRTAPHTPRCRGDERDDACEGPGRESVVLDIRHAGRHRDGAYRQRRLREPVGCLAGEPSEGGAASLGEGARHGSNGTGIATEVWTGGLRRHAASRRPTSEDSVSDGRGVHATRAGAQRLRPR